MYIESHSVFKIHFLVTCLVVLLITDAKGIIIRKVSILGEIHQYPKIFCLQIIFYILSDSIELISQVIFTSQTILETLHNFLTSFQEICHVRDNLSNIISSNNVDINQEKIVACKYTNINSLEIILSSIYTKKEHQVKF